MSADSAARVRYLKGSAFNIRAMGIYWVFGPGEQQVSPIEEKARWSGGNEEQKDDGGVADFT